jgi:sugar-phosphatase
VLFDMDGTLIDSTAAIETAWLRWAAAETVNFGAVTLSHGRTARDLVTDLVSPDRVPGALARLVSIEEEPGAPIALMPGAARLIGALPGASWAIVTSSARTVAAARLRASGIAVVGPVITGDDVLLGKPSPEPFLAGAAALGTSAKECVAFEDAIPGLLSARAAGCFAVGIVGTTSIAELALCADVIVESLDNVVAQTDGRRVTLTFDAAWVRPLC